MTMSSRHHLRPREANVARMELEWNPGPCYFFGLHFIILATDLRPYGRLHCGKSRSYIQKVWAWVFDLRRKSMQELVAQR